ncbi:MAG: hypothetical protein JNK15_19145 [Planctomycetes bacterium]|nr:hypothetical protein [Planctomycetota bacterium]
MSEPVWLLVGVVATLAVLRPWRRRGRIADAIAPAAPAPTPAAPPAPEPVDTAPAAQNLARSIAVELANLTSGVEGRAHRLIEAAADATQVPMAAEALAAAVHRLRSLHTKLVAFGRQRGREDEGAAVTLASVAARIREELQQLQLGLELRWDPPPHLPPIAVAPAIVHDALSFLCAAMLRAERGATRMTVANEPCFTTRQPMLQLELALEWNAECGPHHGGSLDDPTFTLDLEAANHLITSHGGDLKLHHLPGRSVRAIVRLPVVQTPAPAITPPPAEPVVLVPQPAPEREHRFGGALVLEADPAVRAMLASELKAAGRAVFACADGASARTFLEATPDRFELLFVDHPSRIAADDPLAATIRSLAPGLKIFALAQGDGAPGPWPQLRHIQKPFGVHELREALASALAAG